MGAWQHFFSNPCRTGRDAQRRKDGASRSLGWGPSIARAQGLLHMVFLDRPCASCRLHCLLPGCFQGLTQHVECSALHPVVSTKCRLCVIALYFFAFILRCLVHFFLRSLLRVFSFLSLAPASLALHPSISRFTFLSSLSLALLSAGPVDHQHHRPPARLKTSRRPWAFLCAAGRSFVCFIPDSLVWRHHIRHS